jgi:multidrug resistance protein MdtO
VDQDLQPQLRLLMMVKSGLLHHRLLSGAPVSLLIDQVWSRSNELLEESAVLLEDGIPAILPSRASSDRILLHALEQLQSHARTEGSFELATELRLCSSLLHLALQVRDGARRWRGEPIPPPELALAAHA